jgi:MarR family 2-MHQ and catechol resistance regulon transcriptional repressor
MEQRRPASDPDNVSLWSRLSPATRMATVGLVRAWGCLQRWMEPHFRRYGLSQPQFAVLMTLRRSSPDGLTLTELARSIFVTNTNITGLVDRLERDGLVERRRDPEDRRAQLVVLTAQGRAKLEGAWERHPVMLEAAFSGLTERERRKLGGLLEKFTSSLSQAPEILPPRRPRGGTRRRSERKKS